MGGHRRVKRTFHKGQILTLQIQDMAFGGKGIARLETEKGPFVAVSYTHLTLPTKA